MNRRKLYKSVLIFILAVALISSLAVMSLASESFTDLIESIEGGKDDNYITRLERAESAEALYAEMSDDEKAGAGELYAILVAERDELALLAENAEIFIFYVNGFSELHDLDDKLSSLEAAKGDGVFFTDESYPGITETLRKLAAFESETLLYVDICNSFIDAIDRVLYTDENDYLTLSEALRDAEQYVDRIDKTYDGINDAYKTYGMISSAVRVKEEYTEEFLDAVADMKTKTDYKSFHAAYLNALDYKKSESFLNEYPGVAEALEYIKGAEDLMKETVKRANAFKTYVSMLGSSGNIAVDLIGSYAYLDGLDITVDGVASAKATLDSAIESYNKDVERINQDFSYV